VGLESSFYGQKIQIFWCKYMHAQQLLSSAAFEQPAQMSAQLLSDLLKSSAFERPAQKLVLINMTS
jgi:hypothetical protein